MHKSARAAAVLAAAATTVALAMVSPAASASSDANLPVKDPGSPTFTEMGGATPLATDKTIPNWHGQFTDPTNGQTYGYNMVGTDPAKGGSTTVPTDIVPVDIVFSANNGYALNGTDVVDRTVRSPIFQGADYSKVKHSTGGAGELSKGNTGVQYEDAVMRSQFDKTDSSGYHVKLGQPSVSAPVTMTVPADKGSAYTNSKGVTYGLVDVGWFSSRIQQYLGQGQADPTHLPIFLTDNVMLTSGSSCCIIGYHGASKATGNGSGSTSGSGSQGVQTFAYSAYTRPGTFGSHYVRDIHALSHEIAEWGDDPFTNNAVNPWVTPTAPQYGCTTLLETGDPVVGIGFELPGNTYDTTGDGAWHPEDEVFLPWFAREDPNTTSQPVQGGTTGRYTFMGNLNPFPGFQEPATGC